VVDQWDHRRERQALSVQAQGQRKGLKLYVAFKRLKSFATVVPQKNRLLP
jgi:predicted transport protein